MDQSKHQIERSDINPMVLHQKAGENACTQQQKTIVYVRFYYHIMLYHIILYHTNVILGIATQGGRLGG